MKLTRTEPQGFRPVTITLETEGELAALFAILSETSDHDAAESIDRRRFNALTPEQATLAKATLGMKSFPYDLYLALKGAL